MRSGALRVVKCRSWALGARGAVSAVILLALAGCKATVTRVGDSLDGGRGSADGGPEISDAVLDRYAQLQRFEMSLLSAGGGLQQEGMLALDREIGRLGLKIEEIEAIEGVLAALELREAGLSQSDAGSLAASVSKLAAVVGPELKLVRLAQPATHDGGLLGGLFTQRFEGTMHQLRQRWGDDNVARIESRRQELLDGWRQLGAAWSAGHVFTGANQRVRGE